MKHVKKVTIKKVTVAKANVFQDIGNWFNDLGGHHTTKISW